MNDKSNKNTSTENSFADKILSFSKPVLMAIVNLTPDSFYDGGKFSSIKDILIDVSEKIEQGASIIDIGAASSRPGASEVSEDEEWRRLKDPVKAIREEFPSVVLSIDTFRSRIAEKTADLGVQIINDISGGNADPHMFKTIAAIKLPYVLMHMQGNPKTMQDKPNYADVVNEVKSDLLGRIQLLHEIGIHKIILDPGFGFGKELHHNFSLLKHLSDFTSLGHPVLVGLSRKSMINKVLGTNPVSALTGSTILHTIALLNGASILRVHDVVEARQAIELVNFYQNA